MTELESVHLKLPYLAAAQAQKHVTHNEALRRLDSVVQLAVLDAALADPPATPADGDRYIVADGATGAWAEHDGEVATFVDGAWDFAVARTGWLAFDRTAAAVLVRQADGWAPVAGFLGAVDRFGVNATADETNRLAVMSAAVLFSGIAAAEGGSGDIRFIVNKEADGDTASLLFQSGWSGRAEVGLAGDTDFVFKVSPDGSTWIEAIRIDKDTGLPTLLYDNGASGLAATTVQDAIDEVAAAGGGGGGGLVPPQGRLTLASGVAVTTADQTAKTTVYFTPYGGNRVPVYDGAGWTMRAVAELSLALDGNSGHTGYHQSGKTFDLWLIDDAGTVRLATGAAWTDDTTRAEALALQDGLAVNAGAITVRFGAGSGDTVAVAAGEATHLGILRASADGQCEDSDGRRFLWNRYNRRKRRLYKVDLTNSWPYTGTTWRPWNNSTANRVEFVSDGDEMVRAEFAGTCAGQGVAGIMYDSTTESGYDAIGKTYQAGVENNFWTAFARVPVAGYHFLQMGERGNAGVTFYGDNGSSAADQTYLSALIGEIWG